MLYLAAAYLLLLDEAELRLCENPVEVRACERLELHPDGQPPLKQEVNGSTAPHGNMAKKCDEDVQGKSGNVSALRAQCCMEMSIQNQRPLFRPYFS